ncbi:MAG TPA: hypothetical protein PKB06_04020 [Actinotalea sp.]|nr:hypothetical protein [Actinotalea sp.]
MGQVQLGDVRLGALALEHLVQALEEELLLVGEGEVHGAPSECQGSGVSRRR